MSKNQPPNKITKPHPYNHKSSDRRLASGQRAEAYLLSEQAKRNASRLSPAVIAATNQGSPSLKPSDNEWNPKDFRLFVGNLGSDANDAIVLKAFSAYPSVTKVHVPMDHKKGENKGYGFVAFSDPNDYLKAFKEVNGKYIGHHPCTLKKANDLKKDAGGKGKGKRR